MELELAVPPVAMAKASSDLIINNLTGGMNDQDAPSAIADDEVVLAENVEFFNSALGERRRGCEPIDIDGSNLDDEDLIVHMTPHFPKSVDSPVPEFWAIGYTRDTSVTVAHRVAGSWSEVTPTDPINVTAPYPFNIRSQSLHGKLFLMYKSSVDRAHVWDGTTLRATGITAPAAAPTATDTVPAGSFTDDRTYRVRFIEKNGAGVILRRSEPSEELVFTPSGVNDGAVVTRPTAVNEGETHWELEASDGDGNFYIIDTVAIATTTSTDNTQPATDYAVNGTLSEDIGGYENIPSAKFVKADQDRLLFAGSWEDAEKGSRVSWTPVFNAPGSGNDERIPTDTDNFLDLDWMDGGEITGMSDPVNGSLYVFKLARIYKLQRTGDPNNAYEAFLLSKAVGAVTGSVVSGTDEFGRGCVYFLDPSVGPTRISTAGIQYVRNLRTTWRSVNTNATEVIAHGVYYPDKQQLHWWVASNGEDAPNLKMILQINNVRADTDGTQKGWSIATGTITEAWSSTIFPEVINEESTGSTLLSYRPYAGLATPNFIQRCDTQSTDAEDTYRGIIRTKPYFFVGLLNRWGGMNAALLASANADPTITMDVKLIRDFGKETNEINTNFSPETSEDFVLKAFDDLRMASAVAIQIEFSDPA